jgi:hypothetical protein
LASSYPSATSVDVLICRPATAPTRRLAVHRAKVIARLEHEVDGRVAVAEVAAAEEARVVDDIDPARVRGGDLLNVRLQLIGDLLRRPARAGAAHDLGQCLLDHPQRVLVDDVHSQQIEDQVVRVTASLLGVVATDLDLLAVSGRVTTRDRQQVLYRRSRTGDRLTGA